MDKKNTGMHDSKATRKHTGYSVPGTSNYIQYDGAFAWAYARASVKVVCRTYSTNVEQKGSRQSNPKDAHHIPIAYQRTLDSP